MPPTRNRKRTEIKAYKAISLLKTAPVLALSTGVPSTSQAVLEDFPIGWVAGLKGEERPVMPGALGSYRNFRKEERQEKKGSRPGSERTRAAFIIPNRLKDVVSLDII